MVLLNNAPMPGGDLLVYPKGHTQEGIVTRPWQDWFTNLSEIQSKASGIIAKVSLRDQSASISTTDINTSPLSAGLYQVKFYLRLSSVDSISANVTTTIGFTWNGAARALTSNTLGANTLLQTISNPMPLIEIDANTQVTYRTTVTFGSPGPDGRYALDILLFEVDA